MQPIIIFASGNGSNAAAIIDYFKDSDHIFVALIITNNPKAGVIGLGEKWGIPVLIIDKVQLSSEELLLYMNDFNPALIVLAGFLLKIPEKIIEAFPNKMINLHPALLPKYGGKGMYGPKVHEAVKQAKEKVSGITIHFIDEHYDQGQTILQASCLIEEQDAISDIQGKIQKLEHFFLPRTIEFLLNEAMEKETTASRL